MDLRTVKTRGQIKRAFLALRRKLSPEKIKVKDICEKANINKTTFYKYYTDTAGLSDELSASAIEKVIVSFSERDKIFESPKAYAMGLIRALEKEASELRIVFRERRDAFAAQLESRLCGIYRTVVQGEDVLVPLAFAICGSVRVAGEYLFATTALDANVLIERVANAVETLLGKAPAPPQAVAIL